MKLDALFSIEALEAKIEEGLVVKRPHPTLDLYVLNYTAKTQYDWVFDEVTKACRGLIINSENEVIARPFEKFFTYEQLGKFPEGKFEVHEKMDGSLLVVTSYKGNLVVSTRGSFESTQALEGEAIIREKYPDFAFAEGITYLFEVIYPENQIVVKYGGLRDVVLLTIIGNESGKEFIVPHPFPSPKVYNLKDVNEILNYEEDNFEGFVLRFVSGERLKVKTEEYKRLHRLLTGVSEKTIWEALRDGTVDALVENTPDEFYNFVKDVKEDLLSEFVRIEDSAKAYFKDLGDRKENALYYQKFEYPAILFNMLDGKDYAPIIWKFIRPSGSRMFKMVGEDTA